MLERVRRRAHRRQRRGHPHRREPSRVQGRDAGDRPRRAALGLRVHARRSDGDRRAGRLPAHRPAVVHPRAAAAPASPSTPTSCAASPRTGSPPARCRRSSIEQSIAGWKEYELEVMRDHADNVVVICSIENFDAMGVHTGDSITVAPAQTLTDVEYQRTPRRGVRVHPPHRRRHRRLEHPVRGEPGQRRHRRHRDEPARVAQQRARRARPPGSRSPRSRRGLAVGYRLDEIMNDITGETPASFEPTIDYVVTKVPRWAFEKLPGASPVLGTMMQSVGEVMAIGRTFPESLQKALRSLETGRAGLNCDPTEREYDAHSADELVRTGRDARPRSGRSCSDAALRRGVPSSACTRRPGSTRGSSTSMLAIVRGRARVARARRGADDLTRREWRRVKRARVLRRAARVPLGASTRTRCSRRAQRRRAWRSRTRPSTRARRSSRRRRRTTTAPTRTRTRSRRSTRPAVVILGSGPNRIGQGVEFDYCCVHAAFALSDAGYETVMLNCNPETVSTDYDTSDRLFFEPLHAEDVLAVCRRLQERGDGRRRAGGVVVALGGQTPLKLARTLEAARRSRCSAPAPTPSTSPRTASASTSCATGLGHRAAARRHRDHHRAGAGRSPPSSASRCWSARRTCSAVGPCRSSTTTTASTPRWRSSPPRAASGARAGSRPSGRCSSTASSRTRWRSTSTPSATPTGDVGHRRRDGAHRGGRRALGRLRVRDPAADA